VIRESLRRLCIWKSYGEEDGIGEVWWNYIAEFFDRCNTPDFFMNEDCVNDAYKHAGVDAELINNCISNSGGLEGGTNAILDLEITTQTARGVVVVPTAFVNTAALRGQLSVSNVFAAICAGFADGTVPDVCDQCAACRDPVQCVQTGYCPGIAVDPKAKARSAGVSTHTFAVSMLFVIAVFGGVGYWHYNKSREEMRDQVRGILAEYMPLEDQDGSPLDFAQRAGTTSLIS